MVVAERLLPTPEIRGSAANVSKIDKFITQIVNKEKSGLVFKDQPAISLPSLPMSALRA